MFLRLIVSTCIFFASQAVAQQATPTVEKVPDTCPVTKEYESDIYVPPPPYPTKAPTGSFWFGSDRLWTKVPSNGIWRMLSNSTTGGTHYSDKLFWWRADYDPNAEPEPALTIQSRQLGGHSAASVHKGASNGWQDPRQPFMIAQIILPAPGCWEITGRYKEDELTFVVWVTK